jgi:hypothetical protein
MGSTFGFSPIPMLDGLKMHQRKNAPHHSAGPFKGERMKYLGVRTVNGHRAFGKPKRK